MWLRLNEYYIGVNVTIFPQLIRNLEENLNLKSQVSLSLCLSVGLPVCQSVSLSVCQSVSLSVCQSVSLSVCQSVSLSVCQSVSLSVCQSVSLSVSIHVYMFVDRKRDVPIDKETEKQMVISQKYPFYMLQKKFSKIKIQ